MAVLAPSVCKAPVLTSSPTKKPPYPSELALFELLKRRHDIYLKQERKRQQKEKAYIQKKESNCCSESSQSSDCAFDMESEDLAKHIITRVKSKIKRRKKRQPSNSQQINSPKNFANSPSKLLYGTSLPVIQNSPAKMQMLKHETRSNKTRHLQPLERIKESVKLSRKISHKEESRINDSPYCKPTLSRSIYLKPLNEPISPTKSKLVQATINDNKRHWKTGSFVEHTPLKKLNESSPSTISEHSQSSDGKLEILKSSQAVKRRKLDVKNSPNDTCHAKRNIHVLQKLAQVSESSAEETVVKLRQERTALKIIQRAEIYALNEIMRQLEQDNFNAAMSNKV